VQSGERQFHLSLHAPGPLNPHPSRPADQILQQLRLAHAGLAVHNKRAAPARPDVLNQPVQRLPLTAPIQQHATTFLTLSVFVPGDERDTYKPARDRTKIVGPRSEVAAGQRRSCRREVIWSLPKILLRCHSTVRGLMNNLAAISGLVNPSRTMRAI
jgi:hypothetical protein